jgi:hypothetical protein
MRKLTRLGTEGRGRGPPPEAISETPENGWCADLGGAHPQLGTYVLPPPVARRSWVRVDSRVPDAGVLLVPRSIPRGSGGKGRRSHDAKRRQRTDVRERRQAGRHVTAMSEERTGVAVIGLGGAVASTAVAGVEQLRLGSSTMAGLPFAHRNNLVPYDSLVFGGGTSAATISPRPRMCTACWTRR